MKCRTLLGSLLPGKLPESGTKSKSKYLAIVVSATKIDGVWVATRSRDVRLGRSLQEIFIVLSLHFVLVKNFFLREVDVRNSLQALCSRNSRSRKSQLRKHPESFKGK